MTDDMAIDIAQFASKTKHHIVLSTNKNNNTDISKQLQNINKLIRSLTNNNKNGNEDRNKRQQQQQQLLNNIYNKNNCTKTSINYSENYHNNKNNNSPQAKQQHGHKPDIVLPYCGRCNNKDVVDVDDDEDDDDEEDDVDDDEDDDDDGSGDDGDPFQPTVSLLHSNNNRQCFQRFSR
ncbi:hypothetical protein HELRODRAFT_179475 [Helobdella robusta]|uniref:Uncharacterized protein n=1 Tax=Helobdella robusta TaxID=6412 RepID=T1FER5_HELRO|nr:hypothetical protein HELRODRAFT_179475 [Helobdella robusta]ESN95401.1 hypothetical protein HELRODRAFT_179475 [Helobdella robusta]